MEQWSILSNFINYVQYNNSPTDYYKLEVRAYYLRITREYVIS